MKTYSIIILAKCLRDSSTLDLALSTFENLRKERVIKIAENARRNGKGKFENNPFKLWMRDLIMSFGLMVSKNQNDWIYSYRADWKEKVV